MSVIAVALGDDPEGEWMNKLVRFGRYAADTRAHLERVCDLYAEGDQALRRDLQVVVETLWA